MGDAIKDFVQTYEVLLEYTKDWCTTTCEASEAVAQPAKDDPAKEMFQEKGLGATVLNWDDAISLNLDMKSPAGSLIGVHALHPSYFSLAGARRDFSNHGLPAPEPPNQN